MAHQELFPARSGSSLSMLGVVAPERLILAGWIVSRLGLSFLRSVEVGPFLFLPGFLLSVAGCLLLALDAVRGLFRYTLALVISGISLDSLAFWLIRPGSGSDHATLGPWGSKVWLTSFVLLAFGLTLSFFSRRLGTLVARRSRRIPGLPDVAALVSCMVVTVTAFRVSQHLTRHLPNEERSLYILGTEIHHAYQGVLLVALFQILLAARCIPVNRFSLSILGVAAGFVLDQVTYVTLIQCTDEAYGSSISLFGALAAVAVFSALMFFFHSRHYANFGAEEGARVLTHRLRGFGEFEHSPLCFVNAMRNGARYVEVDTRADGDGNIWIYHDGSLGSEIATRGTFRELSSSKLRESRFVDGQPLFRLSEALQTFSERPREDQILCLDIKDVGFESAHLQAVRDAGLEDKVVFISWAPQVLLRLHQLGTKAPLVLSYLDLTRLGVMGKGISRLVCRRIFRIGVLVGLGRDRVTDPLEEHAWGFQHGVISCGLPDEVERMLADQAGGICVPRWLLCEELVRRCRERRLQIWTFSVLGRGDLRRTMRRYDVDVIFCDDAPALLGFRQE